MRTRLLLPGDFSPAAAPLPTDRADTRLLLVESEAFALGAHHRQRIATWLAAGRRYADELRREGWDVEARRAPTLAQGIAASLRESGSRHLVAQAPATRAWEAAVQEGAADVDATVETLPETRFLASREEFASWAALQGGEDRLSVDAWYRELRIRTGLLMEPQDGKKRRSRPRKAKAPAPDEDGDEPAEDAFEKADALARERGLQPLGGRWIPTGRGDAIAPRDEWPQGFLEERPLDPRTLEAIEEAKASAAAFGDAEPFAWPTSRRDALDHLEAFARHRLPYYHKLENAMLREHPLLYASALSSALNLGLLHPREVAERADRAARAGEAPPAAVEAFLRNLVGWREFAHGFYWHAGPEYARSNALGVKRELPDFFANPDYTSLACAKSVLGDVLARGYAPPHRRLMVLANLATLLGIQPRAFASWCERAFVDGIEWATLPATLGLGTFADGGKFTPKPYVSAAAYVARHSNFCGACGYDPEARAERRACPLNFLYWDFIARHEGPLAGNPKLAKAYRILREFGDDARGRAAERAAEFAEGLVAVQGPLGEPPGY